jgi:hypothetical protein
MRLQHGVGATREWFKLGMQQAQQAQQRQAVLRFRQQLIDEIGKLMRPPQPPEPTVIGRGN